MHVEMPMEFKKPRRPKDFMGKKRFTFFTFKTYYKAIVIKIV